MNLAAATGVPVLVWKEGPAGQFTVGQEIILGALVFVGLSLVELSFHVSALTRDRHASALAVAREGEVVAELLAIQDSFESLLKVGDRGGVFRHHFRRELDRLNSQLHEVASTQTLRVDHEDLHLSDAVLDCFTGGAEDELRIVHRLSNNAELFSAHETQWIVKVDSQVRRRRIRTVRRIFLYSHPQEVVNPTSQALIAFHASTARYDYRLMAEEHFDRLSEDYALGERFVDFGVYGNHYLFIGLRYGKSTLGEGMYSGRKATMDAFTTFFDDCWKSPMAHKANSAALTDLPRLTMDQLLSSISSSFRDAIDDGRSEIAHSEQS